MALIESGQRHTAHGHNLPVLGSHPCARKDARTGQPFCRYLFPRALWQPTAQQIGHIQKDPHRPDLRNLFFARNDSLLNSFEPHLLLANLGNIDWRALQGHWAWQRQGQGCTRHGCCSWARSGLHRLLKETAARR